MRSIPKAIPPCGGAPIASASSRKPNFGSLLLRGELEDAEDRCLELGLVDPERAAAELDARCRRGRRRTRRRCRDPRRRAPPTPGVGRVNGWWPAAQRSSSSSHSNIGKSVIQTNRQASSSTSPSSRPRCSRSAPRTRETSAGSSAPKSTVEPGSRAEDASSSSAERNFAIGERTSPSSSIDEVREPLRSPLLGELLEPLELGARELLRHAEEADTQAALAKTPNSEPRVTSVASSISRPKRRSGLSEPKRRSASSQVSRGNGVSSSTPMPRARPSRSSAPSARRGAPGPGRPSRRRAA